MLVITSKVTGKLTAKTIMELWLDYRQGNTASVFDCKNVELRTREELALIINTELKTVGYFRTEKSISPRYFKYQDLSDLLSELLSNECEPTTREWAKWAMTFVES